MRRRFAAALLAIVGISALDTWFCYHDRLMLRDVELNPMVVAILDLGGLGLLLAAKQLGTATVTAVLMELDRRSYRHRVLILRVVLLAQFGVLLTYLPRVA